MRSLRHWTLALPALLLVPGSATGQEAAALLDRVEHRYAQNDGVRLHYAAVGEGPLVVLLHGFPDAWYTWRHLMPELEGSFRVVAPDLRGYNRSDAPEGDEAYAMRNLIGDVLAVIRSEGRERATLVAHDWGGAIAWQVAMHAPQAVERLVVLSTPHPSGFGRELRENEAQRADSSYARDFQQPGAHERLTAEGLARWVADPEARGWYVEAFERSSFEGMLAYYRANYPQPPEPGTPPPSAPPSFPRIRCPVLVLHGLEDRALHASGHAGTWEHVDAPTTLVVIPGAGHFVQHDATELVNRTIADWLARTPPAAPAAVEAGAGGR